MLFLWICCVLFGWLSVVYVVSPAYTLYPVILLTLFVSLMLFELWTVIWSEQNNINFNMKESKYMQSILWTKITQGKQSCCLYWKVVLIRIDHLGNQKHCLYLQVVFIRMWSLPETGVYGESVYPLSDFNDIWPQSLPWTLKWSRWVWAWSGKM